MLGPVGQEDEIQLLDVVDDAVKDEVEDDRGPTLEPLQPRDEICEVRAQGDFHRPYAVDELHASYPWRTT